MHLPRHPRWLSAPVLALLCACRPPLLHTPCRADRDCPPGYACSEEPRYCYARGIDAGGPDTSPPDTAPADTTRADGGDTDAARQDAAPRDVSPADVATPADALHADLVATTESGPDDVVESLDTAARDLVALQDAATDVDAGPPRCQDISLAAGQYHTCITDASGALWCWGLNASDGDLTYQLANSVSEEAFCQGSDCERTPVTACAGGADDTCEPFLETIQLGLGAHHSCARTGRGVTRCWGANNKSQCGDGSLAPIRPNPSQVCAVGRWSDSLRTCEDGAPLRTSFVSSGANHSCGIDMDGGVWCWGDNTLGQLGVGDTEPRPTPAKVCARGIWNTIEGECLGLAAEPLTGATEVAAGTAHTCAVVDEGEVVCWGSAKNGRLGSGHTAEPLEPNPVGVCATGSWDHGTEGCAEGSELSQVAHIAAGDRHTCAVTEDSLVRCWGDNDSGQLGDGTLAPSAVPVDVCESGSWVTADQRCSGEPLTQASALALGEEHSCALVGGDRVACWGSDAHGQLANPTIDDDHTRNPAFACDDYQWGWLPDQCSPGTFTIGGVRGITAGAHHTCAIVEVGQLLCWGDNSLGQLGDGTTIRRVLPELVCAQRSGPSCLEPLALGCTYPD